jgi:uncharacterized protein YndB with AHSA1/START domain
MKLDIALQEFYPHPIEKVWAALTDPDALATWLMMANDFEPSVGRRFTFRSDPNPGWRGRAECEVLALEPPSRMVWSWLSTDEGEPTRVEFRLESVAGGTRLTLEHTGETDAETRSRLTAGWQLRLTKLGTQLTRQSV